MRDIEEIVDDAMWGGKVTKEEVDYVAEKLKNPSLEDEHLSSYIIIIGRTGSNQYFKLIEKYLYYKEDDWATVQALKTLCIYWGLTKNYLKEVKMFIKGVEWDPHDNIRIWALSIAGKYLKKNEDAELLQLLIDVFENKNEDESINEVLQGSAYSAIAESVGKKPAELPDVEELTEIIQNKQWELLDFSPIQKSKERLMKGV